MSILANRLLTSGSGQVGTSFAFAKESGLGSEVKQDVLRKVMQYPRSTSLAQPILPRLVPTPFSSSA